MKPFSNIHEILLLTTTSFSHRQLCERNDGEIQMHLTIKEKLKAACWNGLLEEMLPEVLQRYSNEKYFLWQVETRNSFLKIKLAAYPVRLDKSHSLDPYVFLKMRHMN